MNRRDFLKAGALTLLFAADPTIVAGTRNVPGFLHRIAHAAQPGRTLVTLFCDGGIDSLNFLVPVGDPAYYGVRKKLAIPAKVTKKVDSLYALHPTLAPLLPLYKEGSLAFLTPIGTTDNSRSHFEAKDFLELGGATGAGREGWISKLLQRRSPRDPSQPIRAISTSRSLRLALQGPLPVMTVTSLEALKRSLGGATSSRALLDLYRQETNRPALRQNTEYVYDVMARLGRLHPEKYRPAKGVEYPDTELGHALEVVAFLLKAKVPLEIAYAELNGWDTHANQGTLEGPAAGLQSDLARSIAAFWRDLGPLGKDVTLVTMTEFGRRVQENGSGGTDHGHGSVGLVLGGDVKGGRVLGKWPGLAKERLFEGIDLPNEMDFRDVLLEASAWLGCRDPRALFPGYAGRPVRVLG